MRLSSLVPWNQMSRSWSSAGWAARAALRRVSRVAMPLARAAAKLRGLSSYFSLSICSSKPGRGVDSASS